MHQSDKCYNQWGTRQQKLRTERRLLIQAHDFVTGAQVKTKL